MQRSTSQRPPAPQTLHTASRCPARAAATGQVLAAGTATFNRESRRISREEVGTSCSSPLASARAAGRQRSTSQRPPAPKPYPLVAAGQPGSRNESGSRRERQPLTGKVKESAGRTSVQAGPRRSRAPVQQETSGPRRSALQRPCPPTARLAAATHRPHGPKVQTLAGKVAESAGRTSARAAPRRSHASAQWHGSFHLHALRPPAAR